MEQLTVIQYVLNRLYDIGIRDVFGVPGDFAFPVNDAICNDGRIRWIGCCTELNAAYAADGYARINGVGALCTTYGVGELSALNGVAGSYAEHLPIFHLVGTPDMSTQSSRAIVHHTLGNGEYGLFQKMAEPVVCALALITPQNVAMETERLIFAALYHRRPVYMAFPKDYANQPVAGTAQPVPLPDSDPDVLNDAVNAILDTVSRSATICFLPGILLARTGLQKAMTDLVDQSGVPFTTMFMDKSVLDEQHPNYVGMYDGRMMNEEVRQFVEGSDVVIEVGAIHSDISTGSFTANFDRSKTISICHHHTTVLGKKYSTVEMKDVLRLLTGKWQKRDLRTIPVSGVGNIIGAGDEPITAASLYPRWAAFLKEEDIVIADTGTASMGLAFARMPKAVTFHNQTLWGSIGWATPASFGAAVASPDQRVILITGDGAHQLTTQELGQFARLGLKPIIFLLNNDGYLIERLLCKDPDIAYNDIASWRYTELPHAFGCDDWLSLRVTTCKELDSAFELATKSSQGVFIEIVTDKYAASELSLKFNELSRKNSNK